MPLDLQVFVPRGQVEPLASPGFCFGLWVAGMARGVVAEGRVDESVHRMIIIARCHRKLREFWSSWQILLSATRYPNNAQHMGVVACAARGCPHPQNDVVAKRRAPAAVGGDGKC